MLMEAIKICIGTAFALESQQNICCCENGGYSNNRFLFILVISIICMGVIFQYFTSSKQKTKTKQKTPKNQNKKQNKD